MMLMIKPSKCDLLPSNGTKGSCWKRTLTRSDLCSNLILSMPNGSHQRPSLSKKTLTTSCALNSVDGAFELRRDSACKAWWDYYDRLVIATKQMDDLFGLGDDENCLCHLDLNTAPRNIMAHIDTDNKCTISGNLGCDSAIFAPRSIGCAPPMWIWAWNSEEEEDETHTNDIPATPTQ